MKNIIALTMGMLVAGVVSLQAADAKANWDKHCAKCHGSDGLALRRARHTPVDEQFDARHRHGPGCIQGASVGNV